MSFPGVLHRLLRKFMGGQVVFLIEVRHRNAMGMRSQFVKFRRALMRIVWRDALPGRLCYDASELRYSCAFPWFISVLISVHLWRL
jgi:hypothetical protein